MKKLLKDAVFKGVEVKYFRAMSKVDFEKLKQTQKLVSPAGQRNIKPQTVNMTTRLKHVYVGPSSDTEWNSPYVSCSADIRTAVGYYDDLLAKKIDAVVAEFTAPRKDAYHYAINRGLEPEVLIEGEVPVKDVKEVPEGLFERFSDISQDQ
ncbi:hypothetical protein [Pseudoalteromonas sp. S16_S37]|uniref:hypothetical protein n=1 Tax=Pseudoalteromonas sp. S16_S37 TaxID=2720228 RepID=UPI0016819688|nr:hypothetical protein [Pseudoalteromonas sp. S16_S37]MBD1583126.1 hypothetical protein [Pseudoalteromonas sp. S16_S37]